MDGGGRGFDGIGLGMGVWGVEEFGFAGGIKDVDVGEEGGFGMGLE